MDKHIEDLSEKSEVKEIPTIPRNVAIAVFAILTISGILVGAILPEFIEGTDNKEEGELAENMMFTIIASSIPYLEVGGTSYTNIPVPTAFQVLFIEGNASVDHTNLDTPIGEMMEYMIGEEENFRLTVSPGSGLPLDAVDYTIGTGSGTPEGVVVREVPVGLGDNEGTVIFELRIWGVRTE